MFWSKSVFDSNSDYTYDAVCDAVIRTYHFELREVAKYLRLTKVAAYKTFMVMGITFLFLEGRGIEFCLLYVIPIMISIKIHDMDVYEDFIHGKNYKPLMEVFNNIEDGYFNELLNSNETFGTPDEKQTKISLEEKIKELYDVIFIKQYTRTDCRTYVWEYIFSEGTKEMLLKVAGVLSKYTDLSDD